jgi:crotonobetainyl-CoA:carnitine CoA-transferase CaiB-like acyl-CoA transferase
MHRLNPRLVYLSISGFGHTGPLSSRPGFCKIAEAFSGATHLTGAADSTPMHPGYSLGDATTGLMGAFGIMVALRDRDATGVGQHIDLALYESLMRMIEWQIPLHVLSSLDVHRRGNLFPFGNAFLTDICLTRDGHSIVVSAATTRALERLRGVLTAEEPLDGDLSIDALTSALRRWIADRDRETALKVLIEHDVVAGPVHTAADLVENSQVMARRNIVSVADAIGRNVPMPGVVPHLSRNSGSIRWAGAPMGHQTDEVLREVGQDEQTIQRLRAEGIVM